MNLSNESENDNQEISSFEDLNLKKSLLRGIYN